MTPDCAQVSPGASKHSKSPHASRCNNALMTGLVILKVMSDGTTEIRRCTGREALSLMGAVGDATTRGVGTEEDICVSCVRTINHVRVRINRRFRFFSGTAFQIGLLRRRSGFGFLSPLSHRFPARPALPFRAIPFVFPDKQGRTDRASGRTPAAVPHRRMPCLDHIIVTYGFARIGGS